MFAILGPRGRIFNVTPTSPEGGQTYVELTQAQVDIVGEGSGPKPYFIIDGRLLTNDEARPLVTSMRHAHTQPDVSEGAESPSSSVRQLVEQLKAALQIIDIMQKQLDAFSISYAVLEREVARMNKDRHIT